MTEVGHPNLRSPFQILSAPEKESEIMIFLLALSVVSFIPRTCPVFTNKHAIKIETIHWWDRTSDRGIQTENLGLPLAATRGFPAQTTPCFKQPLCCHSLVPAERAMLAGHSPRIPVHKHLRCWGFIWSQDLLSAGS